MDRTCGHCKREVGCIYQSYFSQGSLFILLVFIWLFIYIYVYVVYLSTLSGSQIT